MAETTEISIPYLSERARVVRYDNGFTFVFVPKQGDVFNVSTWVKTGSIHEDDEINGISHFLEHLMFKGTERFQPGEFDKAMESMGAIINAATWKDFTFYYITGPKGRVAEGNGSSTGTIHGTDSAGKTNSAGSTEKTGGASGLNGSGGGMAGSLGENFERALDMHSDMMLGSTIPDHEVGPPYDPFDPDYKGEKRERSVVIEEISMREDQPWTKIYNSVNSMMYRPGHPYQRDVIGTRQIIGNIPRETIRHYYRKWYSPDTMTTIVVGDFDFAQLEGRIRHYFDFKRFGLLDTNARGNGKHPYSLPADYKHPVEKRYEEITGDYQTTFFIIGYHAPDINNLKESIALDVASHVLGEGRSSRLTQALLEKPSNPVYNYVSCGQSTFKLGNVFFIQGNFTHEDANATLQQLRDVVTQMLTTEPVTEEEFRRALKKLKVDFAETSETASGIAETIGEALTVAGSLDTYLKYMDVLNSLDVDTVNAVAHQYLSLDKAYTSVMVPGPNASKSEEDEDGDA